MIESDTCTVTGLYSYVDGIIKKSVILTGVDTNITPARTPKRKTISPPSMHQVARAHKFQKCGDTGSPTLRIGKCMKKNTTPPARGEMYSPAVGRVKKSTRKVLRAKRTYTPDHRQTLITSVFTPRRHDISNGE